MPNHLSFLSKENLTNKEKLFYVISHCDQKEGVFYFNKLKAGIIQPLAKNKNGRNFLIAALSSKFSHLPLAKEILKTWPEHASVLLNGTFNKNGRVRNILYQVALVSKKIKHVKFILKQPKFEFTIENLSGIIEEVKDKIKTEKRNPSALKSISILLEDKLKKINSPHLESENSFKNFHLDDFHSKPSSGTILDKNINELNEMSLSDELNWLLEGSSDTTSLTYLQEQHKNPPSLHFQKKTFELGNIFCGSHEPKAQSVFCGPTLALPNTYLPSHKTKVRKTRSPENNQENDYFSIKMENFLRLKK